ncbi:MAG: hypothetical protein GXP45_00325 [bacterium]|nr:hypothetical protein [bacterium]
MYVFFVKKKIVISFLIIYIFSYFLQSLFFAPWNKVFGEEALHKTQLVAVFVDKNLYNNIHNDVEWYATQYIQKKITNGKAIVFPINIDPDT